MSYRHEADMSACDLAPDPMSSVKGFAECSSFMCIKLMVEQTGSIVISVIP